MDHKDDAERLEDPEYRKELVRDLNGTYGLVVTGQLSAGQLEDLLAGKLNTMIREDFSGLVRLLYRIDINESRLRKLLAENEQEDAGKIISELILERQWQKFLSRREYRAKDKGGTATGSSENAGSGNRNAGAGQEPEEERW